MDGSPLTLPFNANFNTEDPLESRNEDLNRNLDGLYSPIQGIDRLVGSNLLGRIIQVAPTLENYLSVLYNSVSDKSLKGFESFPNLVRDLVYIVSYSYYWALGKRDWRIPFVFVFAPNPSSVSYNFSHSVSQNRTRHWVYPNFEDNAVTLRFEGYLVAVHFPLMKQIYPKWSNYLYLPTRFLTIGRWLFHMLRALYFANGYNFPIGRSSYYTIPSGHALTTIFVRNFSYDGFITSFTESESAQHPYLIPVSFTFEADRVFRYPEWSHITSLLLGAPVMDIIFKEQFTTQFPSNYEF